MVGDDRAGPDKKDRRTVAASLRPIVEREARRALSEAQLEGDPARLADGWERRFIADAPRAGGRARRGLRRLSAAGGVAVQDDLHPETPTRIEVVRAYAPSVLPRVPPNRKVTFESNR
jgi:hypothetical protein